MADALCGPSNALQSFQKHTQTDRTLQQDRLRGARHSPGQGFRSHDPRAGSLDAEFQAFENATQNPFQLEQPAFHNNVQFQTPGSSASSWATDFQRLHISNQPIPAHQFRTEAPLVRSMAGGWQQEFMRQRQNMTPITQGKQGESSFNTGPSQMNHSELYAPGTFHQPVSTLHQEQSMQPELQQSILLSQGQSHDEHLEQAFHDAFAQIDAMHIQETTQEKEPQKSIVNNSEDLNIQDPSGLKIGSDAIEYTEVKDRTIDHDTKDASELARVAGQLIQNISHETDEKFQNSQFLDLMRKIRDREIEVRNNDFEKTQTKEPVVLNEGVLPGHLDTLRSHDPNTFQFPDMNTVYQPDHVIDASPDYSFDSDQYPSAPRTQISDLHPGGPHYPEQSPPHPRYAQMSGAVNEHIVAEDARSQNESNISSDQYTTA